LSCKYLLEFSEKLETALTVNLGAWWKLIHEKNLKSRISWHCPFQPPSPPFEVLEYKKLCTHFTLWTEELLILKKQKIQNRRKPSGFTVLDIT
jgi:hypothetical protein